MSQMDYSNYKKDELIKIIQQLELELANKKYGLVWDREREPEQVVLDCQDNLPILKEIKDKHIKTDDTNDNILIEGDNYHALSVLNYTHENKIDVVYIDPPYNTGQKDFIYNDEFIEKEDKYRHSKWLNFMEKRLNLAKKVLTDDGIIFASIDDNEYPRLIMLFEKIFNENNVKTIVVKMSEPTGVKMSHIINKGGIAKLKEYLVVAKLDGINNIYLEKIPKKQWDKEYKTLITNATRNDIELIKKIRDNKNHSKEEIKQCDEILSNFNTISLSEYYKKNNIKTKIEKEKFQYDNSYRIFRTVATTGSAKELADAKKNSISGDFFSIVTPRNKMYFMLKNYNIEQAQPRIKILFADDYLTQHPGDFWTDIKTTGLDNEGNIHFPNGKKPIKLIEKILKSIHKDNFTILDFFAGSGTTGEALLKLRNELNANFILCTTNDDKEAICDKFTYPRLKYAIEKYGGNLKYFKTHLLKKTNSPFQTRINLVNECTEMLCIKENIFNLHFEKEDFKIFTSNNKNQYLGIYYNISDDTLDSFLEFLKTIDEPKIVYIFSESNEVDHSLFKGIKKCTLKTIPQKILNIYHQLNKQNILPKTNTIFVDLEKAKKRIFEEKDKDDGASKLRVVLEQIIEYIAYKNGLNLNDYKSISRVNTKLKDNTIITKVKWKENEKFLTIGNDASHGNYDNYEMNQVKDFYKYVQSLISEFNMGK